LKTDLEQELNIPAQGWYAKFLIEIVIKTEINRSKINLEDET
jgi:hypothetical protein